MTHQHGSNRLLLGIVYAVVAGAFFAGLVYGEGRGDGSLGCHDSKQDFYGVVKGKIKTSEGKPASGLLVQALLLTPYKVMPGPREHFSIQTSTETDGEGKYCLGGLLYGEYKIRAIEPIRYSLGDESPRAMDVHESPWVLKTYYPGSSAFASSKTIKLAKGETETADFSLAQIETYSISGKVIDSETGGPLERFKLSIWSQAPDNFDEPIEPVRKRVAMPSFISAVHKGGKWTIHNLPVGTYEFEAFQGPPFEEIGVGYDPYSMFVKRKKTEVSIQNSNLSDVTLFVESGACFIGEIQAGPGSSLRIGLIVQLLYSDPTSEDYLLEPTPSWPLTGSASLKEVSSIGFDICGLKPGNYAINTIGGVPIKSVTIGGIEAQNGEFELRSGDVFTDVRIVLGKTNW
ncbi:MAG: hypothetical protein IPM63_09410 [Acidobacteriota bacterium]|nr:MAG: hypothetical protein IPM63_09410 [Acidobacteriota bacterium]